MNWHLQSTGDRTLVASLYGQVFDSPLERRDLERKEEEGFRLHLYLLAERGGPPSGFGIFLGKGPEVELWHAGVVPGERRKGGGRALVTLGMQRMAEHGYRTMTVCTFNRWNVMLRLLVSLGFRIAGTEYSARWQDLKINLKKEITPKKEIRYALTEECNFDCVFCHNEGLGHEKREPRTVAEIVAVLSAAVSAGYTDITLTGGEPLTQKRRLHDLLEGLAALPAPPDLTMVTNGVLLSAADIEKLSLYPGKLKIHVSLHATDAASFARVTRRPAELFAKVCDNIRRATAAGLTVKVNCVLLQGINHDRIGEAVQVARGMGAKAIKFLELMVLPDSASDFGMYYDSSAITGQVEEIAVPLSCDNPRKRLFGVKGDGDFTVEVQRLTCNLGCSHCREVRDRTFSSDLRYHPCFVREKNSFAIDSPGQLSTVLQQGDRIIDGYAYRYGESSPTLTKKEAFVPGRREFFFRVDSAGRLRDYLAREGFSLTEKKGFHLEYYRPRLRSREWDLFERVLKIGWDHHDQSKTSMISTRHEYSPHPEFGLEVTTRYLDSAGPQTFPDPERVRRFLEWLDFEQYFTSDLQIDIYCRDSLTLSLANDEARPSVRVSGEDGEVRRIVGLLAGYGEGLAPLGMPLEEYQTKG